MNKPRKNLFTYSLNHLFTRKQAFTLAEVLITLGIIGVVAAITIPTLIANTKGIANKNKFKKAVATFSQAARMSQAKYGFDYSGVERCNSVDDKPEEVNTVCALWNGTLAGSKGYITGADFVDEYKRHGIKDPNWTPEDLETSFGVWQLADGTLFITWDYLNYWGDNKEAFEHDATPFPNCTVGPKGIGELFIDAMGCYGFIDVNGPEGPNKEVSCTTGTYIDFWSGQVIEYDSANLSKYPCTVSNKDITDQFPVVIHDGIMEPASNAAMYVMNSAK